MSAVHRLAEVHGPYQDARGPSALPYAVSVRSGPVVSVERFRLQEHAARFAAVARNTCLVCGDAKGERCCEFGAEPAETA
jgi:hypothetical protein